MKKVPSLLPKDAVSVTSQHNWWVLATVGVGTFMSALDGSIVNTVLPVIRRSYGVEVAAVEWIVTVYLLVVTSLLLTVGRLGDVYGHKRMYGLGFVIFAVSSALCGLAPSVGALVAGRGIQAVGSSMLFASGPGILTGYYPPTQRGRVLGLQATMTYLGLTVGPSLGGLITQIWTWRASFYINVPIAMLALLMSHRHVPAHRRSGAAEPFDRTGAVVFGAGLLALVLGLNQGHLWGWVSAGTLTALVGGVVLLALFILLEMRVKHPMLDLGLFRARVFSSAAASAVLVYMCTSSLVFIMPFVLIQGRGLDAARAGVIMSAQPLLMAITAPLSGELSDRIGSKAPASAGLLLLSAALALLAFLPPETSLFAVVGGLAIAGLGVGLFTSPNNSDLMGSVPRNRLGIAGGILATARNLGMALGIGLAGAVFTTVLSRGGGIAQSAAVFAGARAGLAAAAMLALVGAVISSMRVKTP